MFGGLVSFCHSCHVRGDELFWHLDKKAQQLPFSHFRADAWKCTDGKTWLLLGFLRPPLAFRKNCNCSFFPQYSNSVERRVLFFQCFDFLKWSYFCLLFTLLNWSWWILCKEENLNTKNSSKPRCESCSPRWRPGWSQLCQLRPCPSSCLSIKWKLSFRQFPIPLLTWAFHRSLSVSQLLSQQTSQDNIWGFKGRMAEGDLFPVCPEIVFF